MPQSQCTNLELSQELKRLGYPQESLFKWHSKIDENEKRCHTRLEYFPGKCINKDVAATTVAELGERLPKFSVKTYVLEKRVTLERVYVCEHTDIAFTADTEADARAKMLIYLLKNNLIELK